MEYFTTLFLFAHHHSLSAHAATAFLVHPPKRDHSKFPAVLASWLDPLSSTVKIISGHLQIILLRNAEHLIPFDQLTTDQN